MRFLITITIALLVGFTSVQAYNKKGLSAYKKLCVQCHGGPFRGAGIHTIDEWEEITTSSKTPLVALHEGNVDALEKFEDSLSEEEESIFLNF